MRNQIYQLLNKYDEVYQKTNETGLNYIIAMSEEVFNDIRQFYPPKCYNEKGKYIDTTSLQDFVCHSAPASVMDAIEFFDKYICDSFFTDQVNTLLQLNGIQWKLVDVKIENIYDSQIRNGDLGTIQVAGLKELLQEAARYHEEGNLKIAVEKLWDAFVRLKSYYSLVLDKKKSITKIISAMGNANASFIDLFTKEFNELTAIGNNFRIRHHEIIKIDIDDIQHYDYFYKRC